MKFDKEQAKTITKILFSSILFYWLLNNLTILRDVFGTILNILFPFILGGCIAFILNIPMNFFEKKLLRRFPKKLKRIVSIILSIIVLAIIITLIVYLVIPQLINTISLLIENIPFYYKEVSEFIKDTNKIDLDTLLSDLKLDKESILTEKTQYLKNILMSSINLISSVFKGITNTIIAIVFSIYILISKEQISRFLKKIVRAYSNEERTKNIFKISSLSHTTFKNFITGQFTEACILGILCIIGMTLLKIPYAVTIGVLIGFTALIPIVGAFLGVIIGTLLILSVDPTKALIFIIFFLILQQIEGNLIYPKVVGNSVGLPGILVLVAVSVGGSLFGIIGMLIGLPIVSIFYSILQEDVKLKLGSKLINKYKNKENINI